MPIFLCWRHGLAQQLVGALGVVTLRGEVVSRLVVDRIDGFEVDEVDDLNGAGRAWFDRLELSGLTMTYSPRRCHSLYDLGVLHFVAGCAR